MSRTGHARWIRRQLNQGKMWMSGSRNTAPTTIRTAPRMSAPLSRVLRPAEYASEATARGGEVLVAALGGGGHDHPEDEVAEDTERQAEDDRKHPADAHNGGVDIDVLADAGGDAAEDAVVAPGQPAGP